MLAIKYHHLRALIYRPYLYHSLLHLTNSSATKTPLDWSSLGAYERICILEAHEIPRCFHGVSSKEDLVRNFPLWQMIPCLVCASSILLVSRLFAQVVQESQPEFNIVELSHGVDTCLKVFDALSTNSPSIEAAGDMIKALKESVVRCGAELGPVPDLA